MVSTVCAQDKFSGWWSDKVDPNYRHAPQSAVEAWKDLKFGMRIHWGPYSVMGLDASWPLQGSSKEFQNDYFTLYQVFNPTGFNADEWAELAERSGMKYFVFTSRHHDGFSMFNTQTTVDSIRRVPGGSGNQTPPGIGRFERCNIHYSMGDTPYKKDIVAALAGAFRKRGMGVGLYYSWPDWHDPDARWDKKSMYYDPQYDPKADPVSWNRFLERVRQQMRELCTNYGDMMELALDGNLAQGAWPETVKMVEMVRKLQPNVLMRERGIGPYGDFTTPEHFVPEDPIKKPLDFPWEAIEQLGSRWAYQPNDTYKPKEWLVSTLVDVVAKGGNFMPGVSPTANGTFPPETVERLQYVGAWLKINGEAIYRTRPWNVFREGEDLRFTRSKDGKYVYAIVSKWPGTSLTIRSLRAVEGSKITMLGVSTPLRWHQGSDGLTIQIPLNLESNKPCEQTYAFRVVAQPYRDRYE
jgi:alpha-L-fucosidase